MIQNLAPYREVTTLEGAKQVIAMGPVASQEAIKQLGTNGGGFFNANAAHPFESPNAITNFLSMFLIFLIPAGLTYTFGRMARDQRQGWALFTASLFSSSRRGYRAYWARGGNPILAASAVRRAQEGKDVRFWIVQLCALRDRPQRATAWPSTRGRELHPLGSCVPSSPAARRGSSSVGSCPLRMSDVGLSVFIAASL